MTSPSLQRNPDLDSWLSIHRDGRVCIYPGKVELGQAIHAALALIAAEELDVAVERIQVQPVDTAHSADELYTSGSASMEQSGTALRQAAAQARHIMLEQAATELAVSIDELTVDNGEIRVVGGNAWTTYWALMGGKSFDCRVTEIVRPKAAACYRQIGKRPVEPEWLTAIVTGEPYYVHDLVLPDMCFARVLRPPHYLAVLQSVDVAAVEQAPGVVAVVRDGSFLGVVAEREEQAQAAANKLARLAVWEDTATLDDRDIYEQLLQNPRQSLPVTDGVPQDRPIPSRIAGVGEAARFSAVYRRPYHMHASLGPSAAAARWVDGAVTVWTHAQGVYPTRIGLAAALDVADEDVRVIHVPGPGCYGHNGADDAALDAAMLARAVAPRPILLSWSRQDEHAWEPYGSAMLMQLEASLDEAGRVQTWSHETFSDTHVKRMRDRVPGKSPLLAAWHKSSPLAAPDPPANMTYDGGIHRNATPLYDFDRLRVIKHRVRGLPLRVSALRSLGAFANIFAIESFMDELARGADIDPLTFRLQHLGDKRARTVLSKAAETANWGGSRMPEGCGQGLAVARYKNNKCYVAVVIDLDVDDRGRIGLRRAVIAADSGQIVDAEGLRNQLEGGLVQAASWTLKEQVRFDRNGITSRDWESYPILRFDEVPKIETVLVNRPDQPYLGSGEGTMGPTPAAIANAVFGAIGLRLRDLPFTPEKVREAAASD